MTTEKQESPDWDRHDWAGEEHPADEKPTATWEDKEWAGEAPDGTEPGPTEGAAGPSGGGHPSGEQHWAPDEEKSSPGE